jgi:hypothetical protein
MGCVLGAAGVTEIDYLKPRQALRGVFKLTPAIDKQWQRIERLCPVGQGLIDCSGALDQSLKPRA